MLGKILILLSLTALAHGDGRLNFLFFHGPTLGDTTAFDFMNFHTILNHPLFNRARSTIMFHHGANQEVTTSHVFDLIQSYFNRGDYNLVVITYADNTVINVDEANALAQGITTVNINLFNDGYNSGNMYFIGFGLGAQIMARASRLVQNQSNRRHIIGRLTGLEPWNLGPINGLTIGRLSSTDAQFVESVHTDGSGQRGDAGSNGHVAFFVNGGDGQPGCGQALLPGARWDCNHFFALTYWSEAARSPVPTFPSVLCPGWNEFRAEVCNNEPVTNMGRSTEFTMRGSYFHETNQAAPWSRNTHLPIV